MMDHIPTKEDRLVIMFERRRPGIRIIRDAISTHLGIIAISYSESKCP